MRINHIFFLFMIKKYLCFVRTVIKKEHFIRKNNLLPYGSGDLSKEFGIDLVGDDLVVDADYFNTSKSNYNIFDKIDEVSESFNKTISEMTS